MESGRRLFLVRSSKFPLDETNFVGRESFLVPMTWEDDWPVINGGEKISLLGSGPDLYQLEAPSTWRDDFEKPDLTLGWYRKSKPLKVSLSFT